MRRGSLIRRRDRVGDGITLFVLPVEAVEEFG